MVQKNRTCGVLLHITSLPSTPGIGTLGKSAFRFIDWLHSAHFKIWQVLPIGPTGYGDSPYASFSTFAGNPLLIDLDLLVENGFLTKKEAMPPSYIKSTGNVDFGSVVWWKIPVLKIAARNFIELIDKQKLDKHNLSSCFPPDFIQVVQNFEQFKKQQKFWLDDYSTFMSIKEFYDNEAQKQKATGAMWSNFWPLELARHQKDSVSEWQTSHKIEIEVQKVIQFFFFTQWASLKEYASKNDVSMIGDIPIFVAADSADVWANQHLFILDENARQLSVAGVPPDYFSETGQLWGNPLYNWDEMQKDDFSWWLSRIKTMLNLVDFVRIDHFRGFEAFWAIPASEKTAINGKWIKAPGKELFKRIQKKLGEVPIIAEDLGVITDEVKELRDMFNLPGMKVLQFAFDPAEEKKGSLVNTFLPHMYTPNCIAYTGTHDNDTTVGLLDSLKNGNDTQKEQLKLILKYLGFPTTIETCNTKKICQNLVRLAISSTAAITVIPLQDIFTLGTETRMNTPSTNGGNNWQWRMSEKMLRDTKKAEEFATLAMLYGRT